MRYNLFDHLGSFAYFPGRDLSLPCLSPPTACLRNGIYLDDHEGAPEASSDRGARYEGVTPDLSPPHYPSATDITGAMQITGNIFAGVEVAGIFMHNGRDMSTVEGGIDNNLFYRTQLGVRISGTTQCGTSNATLYKGLEAMPYARPPWSRRYPLLANITHDYPCQPLNNAIGATRPNAATRMAPTQPWIARHGWYTNYTDPRYGGGWLSLPIYLQVPGDTFNTSAFDVGAGNWAGDDIGFASPEEPLETLDFALSPSSPLWQRGWQRIPEELIGVWARGVL